MSMVSREDMGIRLSIVNTTPLSRFLWVWIMCKHLFWFLFCKIFSPLFWIHLVDCLLFDFMCFCNCLYRLGFYGYTGRSKKRFIFLDFLIFVLNFDWPCWEGTSLLDRELKFYLRFCFWCSLKLKHRPNVRKWCLDSYSKWKIIV